MKTIPIECPISGMKLARTTLDEGEIGQSVWSIEHLGPKWSGQIILLTHGKCKIWGEWPVSGDTEDGEMLLPGDFTPNARVSNKIGIVHIKMKALEPSKMYCMVYPTRKFWASKEFEKPGFAFFTENVAFQRVNGPVSGASIYLHEDEKRVA